MVNYLIFCINTLIFFLAVCGFFSTNHQIVAAKADRDPEIDGRLDDFQWAGDQTDGNHYRGCGIHMELRAFDRGIRREQMFKEERDTNRFSWNSLGNIDEGRPNLGPLCTVLGYRLLQYTLRDELIKQFDVEKGREVFQNAGRRAGEEFCKEILDTSLDFNDFVADLQKKLKDHLIGILRIERADIDTLTFTLTVEEDLDCSGLPVSDETVCEYDEGFVEGILSTYTGKKFTVKEVDCWASGDRVCRFSATAKHS